MFTVITPHLSLAFVKCTGASTCTLRTQHCSALHYSLWFHFFCVQELSRHSSALLLSWTLLSFQPVWVEFHSLDSSIPCPLPVSCDSTFHLAYVVKSLCFFLSPSLTPVVLSSQLNTSHKGIPLLRLHYTMPTACLMRRYILWRVWLPLCVSSSLPPLALSSQPTASHHIAFYLFSTNQHFAVIISNLALLEGVALKLIANLIWPTTSHFLH